VLLDEDLARDVATLCGLRDTGDPLLTVAEDTLRDNFTKAQMALGIRHRSLYQAKHTYATLELLAVRAPRRSLATSASRSPRSRSITPLPSNRAG